MKYLSQYFNPVHLVPEPVLLTNIRYTIGGTGLGPEAWREKFRLCKSPWYGLEHEDQKTEISETISGGLGSHWPWCLFFVVKALEV